MSQLTQQQEYQIANMGKAIQVLQEDMTRLIREINHNQPLTELSGGTVQQPQQRGFPMATSAPKDFKDWCERSGLSVDFLTHPVMQHENAQRRVLQAIAAVMESLIKEYDGNMKRQEASKADAVDTVAHAGPPTVNPPGNLTAIAEGIKSAGGPPTVSTGPKSQVETAEEQAAKERALLEEDTANLKRTIQHAFSAVINPNFRGTFQWQEDNSDNFDADIFAQAKNTIVEWPEGFYRDNDTKSPQYRGAGKDFVFLLDFAEQKHELCSIILPAIRDNIIVPWSSLGTEHRRLFTQAIWEYLKGKVIPQNHKPQH